MQVHFLRAPEHGLALAGSVPFRAGLGIARSRSILRFTLAPATGQVRGGSAPTGVHLGLVSPDKRAGMKSLSGADSAVPAALLWLGSFPFLLEPLCVGLWEHRCWARAATVLSRPAASQTAGASLGVAVLPGPSIHVLRALRGWSISSASILCLVAKDAHDSRFHISSGAFRASTLCARPSRRGRCRLREPTALLACRR